MSSKRNYPTWIGITLSFYAFIAIGIAEGGLGVLLPSILSTYNLTPATVTLLFLSQVTGYVIAAFTSSLLSNRIGLARMLLLAAIILTTALIIYAIAPDWAIMVASGTLLGTGIGLIDAGINTYIANQRNANLMGILHAFYGIGAFLGPTLATTLLALGLNWRQIYLYIASIVGITIIGILWTVVYNYKPMTVGVTASNTDAWASLRLALKTPAVLVSGLLLLIYVGTEASVGNWAYSVQNISRGIPETVAGYNVSAYWLGLTIGRLTMGRLIERLGAVHALDFSLALLTASLVSWWLLPNLLLSLPLIGFALAAIFPATIWLMPQRVSSTMVPAAIGFVSSTASLGAATIPTLLGWMSARIGLESIPALLLPLAIVMVALHRALVRHTTTN